MSDIVDIIINISEGIVAGAILGGIAKIIDKCHNKKNDILIKEYLCDYFNDRIVTLYIEIKEIQKTTNPLSKIKIEKKYDTILIHKPLKKNKKLDLLMNKIMVLFNAMDAYAVRVLSDFSEKEYLAYETNGKAFCDIINDLNVAYEMFMITNSQDYVHLRKLYNIWNIKY